MANRPVPTVPKVSDAVTVKSAGGQDRRADLQIELSAALQTFLNALREKVAEIDRRVADLETP